MSMLDNLHTLILGDVYGQPGFRAVFIGLKNLIKEKKADLVIVNGENAADGFGLTPEIAGQILSAGAHVITSGNHIWHQREILPQLEDSRVPVIRPANYPPGTPGKGYTVVTVKGKRVGVLNLQGRSGMSSIDCPFRTAGSLLKKMKSEADFVVVDFHAESPEEKEALGIYLDGKVSLLVGTHTHIQTADERILPGGTGYITDIGMCGPELSVIGSDPAISIRRFLTQMPLKIEVSDNPSVLSGVLVKIEMSSGKTVSIERFRKKSLV